MFCESNQTCVMIILCELKSAMLELEPLVPDPTSWDSFFVFSKGLNTNLD
jgi:hypothetical protein